MKMRFKIADAPDAEDREIGRKLFAGGAEFLKGVVAMDGMPPADRLEVCFAGRSNVGKSSLINALTRRKALARTSNTPGRTQEINFFPLGSDHFLVDVPGYGFAKAPLPIVEKWQQLLKAYLSGRQSLRRVFLLIDGRQGAKAVDEEIMQLLSRSAVTFQIIITKCDKPRKEDLEKSLEKTIKVLEKYPAAFPEIIMTSSEKGDGIETLRTVIATMV